MSNIKSLIFWGGVVCNFCRFHGNDYKYEFRFPHPHTYSKYQLIYIIEQLFHKVKTHDDIFSVEYTQVT